MRGLFKVALLLVSIQLFGQTNNTKKEWYDLMQDPNANFFETQAAFYDYWKDKTPGKGEGYKPFKRWEWFNELEVDERGNFRDYSQIRNEVQQFRAQSHLIDATGSGSDTLWEILGPINQPVASSGQPNGMGRINAVGIHPTNSSILFVGAPNGGIWRTYNFGATWVSNTDTLPTMQISSIVFNTKNPNIVYAGTGDRDGNSSRTQMGVIKSIDGGITWNASNTGMGNRIVGKMIVDPDHPDTILAATNGGIYKTINGGASWSRKSSNSSNYKDIEAKPGDFNKLYATANGAFYYSHDNGETWSRASGYINGTRGAIAVSKADPSKVYFIQTSSRVFSGLCLSTDDGQTFTTQSTTPNIMDYSSTGSGNSGQAWYDLDITADPNNADILYVGGVNVFRSADGGKTWRIAGHWLGSIHADQHVLEWSTDGRNLISGNDGGVYYTGNGGNNWDNISSGLAISEIYKIGQHKWKENRTICGYQDNGTAIYRGKSDWTTEIGGDGMECAFDPNDSLHVYGELYYGAIRRSTNGGRSFGNITSSISEQGAWVSPFIIDEGSSSTMFAGYNNIYRTNNLKSSRPSWTNITTGLSQLSNNTFRVLEQSPADNNVLFAVRSDNKLFISTNAKANSPGWRDISNRLPAGPTISDIEAHPTDPNILYITRGARVYVSIDQGNSWTDISRNLPSSTKRTIVYDEFSKGGLYVGGTPGVYYIDSTLNQWLDYSKNLPGDVSVTELEIFYDQNNPLNSKIRAATYGRGLWSAPLFDVKSRLTEARIEGGKGSHCLGDTVTIFADSSRNANNYLWDIQPTSFQYVNNTTNTSKEIKVVFTANGYYDVKLLAQNSFNKDSVLVYNYIHIDNAANTSCITSTQASTITGSGIFEVELNGTTKTHSGYDGINSNHNHSCEGVFYLLPDSLYNLNVKTGNTVAENTAIYIDYNGDGDFNDPGEAVANATASTGTKANIFRTPTNPTINQKLNMRIISDRSPITGSCASLGFGESRDYAVIFDIPDLSIIPSSKLACPNESVSFSYMGRGKIESVEWDFGKGASQKTSTDRNPTDISYSFGGTKYITLTVNGAYSFTDSIAIRFSPYANLVVDSAKSDLCESGNVVLKLIDSSGAPNAQYQWFLNNRSIQAQGDTLVQQKLFGRLVPFNYYVIAGDTNCSDTSELLVVRPKEKPQPQMSQLKALQCLRGNVYNIADNTVMVESNFSRSWKFGDGQGSTSKTVSHTYTQPGLYTIELEIIADNGCSNISNQTVRVLPHPDATFTENQLTGKLDVTFMAADTNVKSSVWDFGDGNTAQTLNPTHSYLTDGNYTVIHIGTNNEKCADTSSHQITIEKIAVPSGFATVEQLQGITIFPNPASGSINLFIEQSGDYSIRLTDALGKIISTKDISIEGEGTEHIQLPKAGVYLLLIQSNGQQFNYRVINQ